MKKILILLSTMLFLSGSVFAAHTAGVGHGMGHSKAVGKVITPSGSSAIPPGLAKHGKYPHGLSKKGKIPHGWTQGKKKGWKAPVFRAPEATTVVTTPATTTVVTTPAVVTKP